MVDSGNNGHSEEVNDEMRKTIENTYKELLGPLYKDGGFIKIEACPKCGCRDRVFESMYNYLVFLKRMPAGMSAYSSVNAQSFLNTANPGLVGAKVPTLSIYRDICRGCGMEYPVLIERRDGVLSAQGPGIPPRKLSS